MANGAKIRSGLANLMQDHLSSKVVDTILNIMPLTYALTARYGNKQGNLATAGGSTGIYGLGRYGTGAIMSGVPMSKPRIEQVLNSDTYMPIIKTKNPAVTDGKVMGQRDTLPKRTSWDVNYPATYVARPAFKWVERVDPIEVPKKDIRRTKARAGGDTKKANAAIGDLFKFESESVLSTHLQWWNTKFWGTDQTIGTDPTVQGPSNADAEVWDNINSISSALGTSNVYGSVDRSLAANAYFRGNLDTSATPAVLEDIINNCNYKKGCAKKGVGINLILCGASLFPIFWAEAKAKGQMVYADGMPDMAQVGYKKPVIRFNNTFVLYDPECPDKLHDSGAYTANHLAALNLDTFTLAFQPDANFTVEEPFDNSRTKGGDDSLTSNLRTELISAVEAPSLNAYFTQVG